MKTGFLSAVFASLLLQGCVASMAVSAVGDVAEGTANVALFTAKTSGKAVGAVLPGGGDDEDEDER
ncbi:MAG: hypothetical protein AAF603_08330 [Pseudomonadota bacterium]